MQYIYHVYERETRSSPPPTHLKHSASVIYVVWSLETMWPRNTTFNMRMIHTFENACYIYKCSRRQYLEANVGSKSYIRCILCSIHVVETGSPIDVRTAGSGNCYWCDLRTHEYVTACGKLLLATTNWTQRHAHCNPIDRWWKMAFAIWVMCC